MECNTCNVNMDHVISDLWICHKCGLISSSIFPDISLYDKSYLRKYERYANTPLGDAINTRRIMTLNKIHPRHEKVLDFGCGSGSFVQACIREEIPAVGFDINPYSPYCNVESLFNGHKTVTFWDSLEHTRDPKAIILGLRSDNIIVNTPSTDDHKGPIRTLVAWHHYYPGEHVHYYNEKSLIALLTVCGYNIEYLSYSESACRTSGDDQNILTIGGKRG